MERHASDVRGEGRPGCNVNSTFNFTVGGLAIAVAVLLGYIAYARWW
jgi:hypothetical protein